MYFYKKDNFYINSPLAAKVLGEESKYIDHCVQEEELHAEDAGFLCDKNHAKRVAQKSLSKVNMEDYVFHGSRYAIRTFLEPKVSFDRKPLVYATNDYNYALLRAGRFNPQVFSIKEDYDANSGEFRLIELAHGAFDYLFNTPGFVYVLNKDNFNPHFGTEWVSEEMVQIQCAIKIDNLMAEMKNSGKFVFIGYDSPENEFYGHIAPGVYDDYLIRRAHRVRSLNLGMPQEACEPGYSADDIMFFHDELPF